jgi:FtsP/CotA-like multicopper oxidase with cupredoxin domain
VASILAVPRFTRADEAAMRAVDGMPRYKRVPFTEGAALIEPEVRSSSGGVLATTLHLRYTYKDVGGYRLFVRSYEGMIPGPTLRVRPGDVLRISLVNDLPPDRTPAPAYPDQPHLLNTTNLHTHGLHVSPSGISDNVFRAMPPGGTYDIEIAIPHDQPAGTYWYHPHHHGSADVQIASGVAGALIIEGDFGAVPEIAAARERVLVLGEAVFDSLGMIEDFETLFPETSVRFHTVNGQRAPTIAMRPGEIQRWRFVHAGYQDDINLALAKHEFRTIARDGIALRRVGEPMRSLVIAPGQRYDVLVRAGGPEVYELRALPYAEGYSVPTGLVARVVVAGEPMTMEFPSSMPAPPLRSVRDEELTGKRRLTFGAVPGVEQKTHWQEFTFPIDGRVFDPNHVDQRIKLGAVEEWTIVNLDTDDHVFHIHVNPFQLTHINGTPLAEPVWLDTAILAGNGSLTFRSRFDDFTGRYALHCHMMNHEELGMMQVVEVHA